MNKQELIEFLNKFTYKPGFVFRVDDAKTLSLVECVFFTLMTSQPNADDGGKTFSRLARTIEFRVGPESTPDWVRTSVENLIRGFEEHEVQEWLRFDGERVYQPHEINFRNSEKSH